jgi:hypothetical protein
MACCALAGKLIAFGRLLPWDWDLQCSIIQHYIAVHVTVKPLLSSPVTTSQFLGLLHDVCV